MFGKIAGFFLLQKTVSEGTTLVESLLAGLAALLILSMIATILLASVLLGGVYAIYLSLVLHGIPAGNAITIVGVILVSIFTALVILTVRYIRIISGIPKRLMRPESPITRNVTKITNAFLDGFSNPEPFVEPVKRAAR